MREFSLVLIAIVLMLGGSEALAAPTCQDTNGGTIRCGSPGAMPVGWTVPPEVLLRRQHAEEQNGDSVELLKAVCLICLLLTLIALLPDFDGTRDRDWDEQEGDNNEREM